jgi:hypothetical protein
MGKIRRIRIRGKQRTHPDAALVAQAIIQLGREIWEREQREAREAKPEDKS